jgi:hypothetical protein
MVKLTYKDQGWGNRKGAVYLRPLASSTMSNPPPEDWGVMANSTTNDYTMLIPKDGGAGMTLGKYDEFHGIERGNRDRGKEPSRYLHYKGPAGHEWERVEMGITVGGEGIWGIFVGIGGGGGHKLHVKDFVVEIVEVTAT